MGVLAQGLRTANGEMVHGSAAADELTKRMAAFGGAANNMSRGVSGEMATQLTRLRTNIEMFVDLVGGPLTKVFAPVLAIANEYLKRLNRSVAEGQGAWGTLASAMDTVSLAFNGLLQLISQGGFSGKVREEMGKAENSGVKYFALQVWHWIGVLGELWDGFVAGWEATMEGLQPVWDALVSSLKGYGDALGLTSATADQNATVWDTLGEVGTKLGTVIAFAATTLAGAFTMGMYVATLSVNALKAAWQVLWPTIRPIVMVIIDTIAGLAAVLNGDLNQAWRRMAAVGVDAVRLVVGAVASLLKVVFAAAALVGKLFGADLGLNRQLDDALARFDQFREELVTGIHPNVIPMQTAAALPTSSEDAGMMSTTRGESADPAFIMASMAAEQGMYSRSAASSLQSMASGPASGGGEQRIIVPVSIDGEKVGEAVAKVGRRKDARAFKPGRQGRE